MFDVVADACVLAVFEIDDDEQRVGDRVTVRETLSEGERVRVGESVIEGVPLPQADAEREGERVKVGDTLSEGESVKESDGVREPEKEGDAVWETVREGDGDPDADGVSARVPAGKAGGVSLWKGTEGAVGAKGAASEHECACTVDQSGELAACASVCCAQRRFEAGSHVTVAEGSSALSACTTVTALALLMLPPPLGEPPAQPAAL